MLITEVDKDSDAATKGLKSGDIILDVQGQPVATPADVETGVGKVKAAGRPAVLLRVRLTDLARWADGATTHQVASLTATHHEGVVLLRGDRLPALPGVRYWGERILVPLGRRAAPDLGEAVLATALQLEPGEVALLGEDGAEVIPLAAFAPLTRAGVRLAGEKRFNHG